MLRVLPKPGILITALAGPLVLAACHDTGQPTVEARYTLSAEEKTFRTEIPVPWSAHEDGSLRVALPEGFLADYQRRARSPLRLMPPLAMTSADGEAIRALADWLEHQGIPTEVLNPATAFDYIPPSPGTVGLSFRAFAVTVPNCGDWSGETGFNPSNLPHTNFGCSVTRNIGLMLSDPGDLHQARPTGSYDSGRIVTIMTDYRTGKTTASEQPTMEDAAVSTVAQ